MFMNKQRTFERNFIKQLDAMDCGPSCLAMIASWYGVMNKIYTFRSDCSFSKTGVSLLNISQAAEKAGFHSVGGRISFTTLSKKVLLPCIAHWDQNHFVVIYKIKKRKNGKILIYIADPSKGLITYTEEEFCSHWISSTSNNVDKGIVLLLEPTNEFYAKNKDNVVKSGQVNKHIVFLWKYVVKYKRFFLQLIVGIIVGSFIQLILPFLTQSIVDTGIQDKDIKFIWLILIAQSMLVFSRTAIDFIRNKILLHISTRINISLISNFFIKLMMLPMAYFDTKLLGDILQRIEDHRRVEDFLTSSTLKVLFSFFTFIILGVVLFIYNVNIFLVFLLGSIIYGIWTSFFLKKRKSLDYKSFAQESRNRNATYQLINGMQEIKLQGCEHRKRWEWEDVQADLFEVNLELLNLQQKQQIGSTAINEIKNILITVLAASSVINGEMTLGMMLSVQYIIGQLNSPIEELVRFTYIWQDVSISLNRMNDIHNEREENKDRKVPSIFEEDDIFNNISINNLCFKYNNANPNYVIDDVSFVIPKGKVTAIVGTSGSGKTTLIKLILGYYPPQKGNILIGSQNLQQLDLSWWRANSGVVMQEGYIFSDTIAQNIAISDDSPDIERIRYAARIANIADYIESLPLAYNTLIGQDGQGISQGQKQRILIARIVYKNPKYIFLDEATNALDANNEKIIIENLSSFYKGKTVIIVAHRLSTVQNADQIIVLDNGKITETGTHLALIRSKGAYYKLVKNQLELGT